MEYSGLLGLMVLEVKTIRLLLGLMETKGQVKVFGKSIKEERLAILKRVV